MLSPLGFHCKTRYIPAYEILDVDCNRNSWLGSLSTTFEISSLYILKVTVSLLLYCNLKLTESKKRCLNLPTPIKQMQLPITRIVKSIPWKERCVRIPPGPQKGLPSSAVVIGDSYEDKMVNLTILAIISPLSFLGHMFLTMTSTLSFLTICF